MTESSSDPRSSLSAAATHPQEVQQSVCASDGVRLWTCQLENAHWRSS